MKRRLLLLLILLAAVPISAFGATFVRLEFGFEVGRWTFGVQRFTYALGTMTNSWYVLSLGPFGSYDLWASVKVITGACIALVVSFVIISSNRRHCASGNTHK